MLCITLHPQSSQGSGVGFGSGMGSGVGSGVWTGSGSVTLICIDLEISSFQSFAKIVMVVVHVLFKVRKVRCPRPSSEKFHSHMETYLMESHFWFWLDLLLQLIESLKLKYISFGTISLSLEVAYILRVRVHLYSKT